MMAQARNGTMGRVSSRKIWLVFGTRPEAIKLAPVYHALKGVEGMTPVVCVTAQHREMLDHVLGVFDMRADYDLDLMGPDQALHDFAGKALQGLGRLFRGNGPDLVLVQGDTTTTLMAALAAFYNRVPVGHVEAGLRTGRMDMPFPEEANRILTTRLASLHFAPTRRAAEALHDEGVAASAVLTTGNTVVDALNIALQKPPKGQKAWRDPGRGKILILVTAHRRESFGGPMASIFSALKALSERGDVEIVIPLHPNPNVRRAAEEALRGGRNIQVIDPLEYLPFVHLMKRADIILTDSGGIQEEAPSLGIPVLVLRETTERPEAVEAGVAKVVGTRMEDIVREASRLLDDPSAREAMTGRGNPFGDGRAAGRIVDGIEAFLSQRLREGSNGSVEGRRRGRCPRR